MKEFTIKQEKKIGLGDGYYSLKSLNREYIKIDGDNLHKIYLGHDGYVNYTYNPPLTPTIEDFEIITEQEWRNAVADLLAAIYLSLPIGGKQ